MPAEDKNFVDPANEMCNFPYPIFDLTKNSDTLFLTWHICRKQNLWKDLLTVLSIMIKKELLKKYSQFNLCDCHGNNAQWIPKTHEICTFLIFRSCKTNLQRLVHWLYEAVHSEPLCILFTKCFLGNLNSVLSTVIIALAWLLFLSRFEVFFKGCLC